MRIFYKFAGSDAEEMVYGNKIIKLARFRLPWLLVSVATGLLTAAAIGCSNIPGADYRSSFVHSGYHGNGWECRNPVSCNYG